MAFIRWKHDGHGGRQAYLVHAYRGPDGKPKQKILAYLGDRPELTTERLRRFREKHPDLQINWEAIKTVARPTLNVSLLSEADLLRKVRHLRRQLNLKQSSLLHLLIKNGLPPCRAAGGSYPYNRHFGILEKALEAGQPQPYYLDPLTEIAPALRKVVTTQEQPLQ